MSQMPPPPPSEPAPMGGQPGTAASNSKTNVILAYLLWWVTGIIFLFVGKNDPDVKWNAAQPVALVAQLVRLCARGRQLVAKALDLFAKLAQVRVGSPRARLSVRQL